MPPFRLPIAFLAIALATAAHADPVGDFVVAGGAKDDDSAYQGTVNVRRTGATYAVNWIIDGVEFSGTGIGGRRQGETIAFGPAGPEDSVLAVVFRSADAVGTATYVEQADGSWLGSWTYEGEDRLSTESWTTGDEKALAATRSLDKAGKRPAPLPQSEAPKAK